MWWDLRLADCEMTCVGARNAAISILLAASTSSGSAFVNPAASRFGAAHGLRSVSLGRPAPLSLPVMAAHEKARAHSPETAGSGRRHFSSIPYLGALAAAAGATALPAQVVAAEDVAEVAQVAAASLTQSAGMDQAMVEIGVFLAKTVISWGVPAAVIGLLLVRIITAVKPGGAAPDPLDDGPMMGPGLFGMLRRKPGEPEEMLKIERLNDRLDSFQYSLQKLDKGRRGALLDKRRKDFERAYGIAIGHLTDKQLALLLSGDLRFRTRDEQILSQIDDATQELRALAVTRPTPIPDPEYKSANETESDGAKPGMMEGFMGGRKMKKAEKKLAELLASRVRNEMQYVSGVSALLGKNERQRLELLLRSRRMGPLYTDPTSTLSLSHALPAHEGAAETSAGKYPLHVTARFRV
jgi:hypothetical protein